MIFNSVDFFIFLSLVLVIYWRSPPSYRNGVLVVASYAFYGWWDWRFLGLLVVSTVVDYSIGRRLHREQDDRNRLLLLLASVAVNLGILGFFKYANFFSDGFSNVLKSLGLEADPLTLNVILPVGISFYTFQTLSYTFDVYRRRIAPTSKLIDFATYVAYFPQLVAGPIERAQRLLPQITNTKRTRPRGAELEQACGLILLGLVKKVVLADGVARVADDAFGAPGTSSWLTLSAGVIAFSIQIYGDFSGYTDIARGVSMLLGIDLVVNFREPYLSRNITEFWRRWHISLSNWLRDYLYIPLGGNRGSTFATYRNLLITMLLGGLWHGASWNFVIWGGLHGAFLIVHRLAASGTAPDHRVRWSDLPTIALTNIAVMVAWVFFRAETLSDSWQVISRIFTLRSGSTAHTDVAFVAVMAMLTVALDIGQRRHGREPSDRDSVLNISLAGVGAGAAVVGLLVFSGGSPTPFIYFQF